MLLDVDNDERLRLFLNAYALDAVQTTTEKLLRVAEKHGFKVTKEQAEQIAEKIESYNYETHRSIFKLVG